MPSHTWTTAARPPPFPTGDGEILTPSAVYLAEDGTAVVGQPALDMALEQPERVATMMKRRMGLPDLGRPVAGRSFRPETLSAVLLRKLVLDAEARLGPITQAVITVPAYFDDSRRKATMDAGRIAGLDVLDILDEPSAAALAYTVQTAHATTGELPADAPKTVLVYDLGGGTFDVTLVKLGKKRFQVLAIEGDVRLGGKDFDDRVVQYAADQFRALYGSDPRQDAQSLAMLQAAAERAKRTLSKVSSTTVTAAHAGHKLSVPLSRDQFNSLTQDLLLRTRLTTQTVVQQAGLTWPQVDKVLMVGGSTHMPMTGQMLAELAGREPDRSLAVSEVVARGAAVHAGIVTARKAREAGLAAAGPLADVVEVSVNAHSLGVEVRSGDERLNNKLIPKNTQLPAAVSRGVLHGPGQRQQGAGPHPPGGGAAGRGEHPGRRGVGGRAAAGPAEGVAGAGAVRGAGQRPHRGDGPGHDQRPAGPGRHPPHRRHVRGGDRGGSRLGAGLEVT